MSTHRPAWLSSMSRVVGSAPFWQNNASIVILVLFVLFSTILTKGALLRPSNVATILYQTSTVGVLTMGQVLVVIAGGVSLAGGSGGTKQALGGILFLAVLSNFMNIMLISPHVQYAINGAVILAAVSLYGRLRHGAD
ncbi:MAG: hypothetical protein JO170_14740 [Verrucomicrobia bacterium]|nr:hypothetical protein [Verrucomicrobiota bacterium]